MTKTELLGIIDNPSSINKEMLHDLQDYVKECPYSQTFRMLYLKGLDNVQDVRFGNELKTTSLYVTNRRNLFQFITKRIEKLERKDEVKDEQPIAVEQPINPETKGPEIVSKPTEKEVAVTIADIEAYLEGKTDDSLSDLASPVKDNPLPLLKHQDLIDNFLQASETSDIYVRMDKQEAAVEKKAEEPKQADEPKNESEEFFTETLARIYIKQHKFEKAIKIFKRLSLKYPEKSIYFVDQIRFFEKLIENYKIKK